MLTVSFKPRQSKHVPKDRRHSLYCTVSIDAIPAVPFSTKIRVNLELWKNLHELVALDDRIAKEVLRQTLDIEADLRQVFNDLRRTNSVVTADDVAREYTGRTPTFLKLFDQMVEYRVKTFKITKGTVETWETRRKNAAEFIRDVLHKEDIRVDYIRSTLEDDLIMYFNTKGFKKIHVSRQVSAWKSVMSFAVKKRHLKYNPLEYADVTIPPPGMPKFLTVPQLEKLSKLSLPFEMRIVADIFLFQCYTGMSIVDVYNFNPEEHIFRELDGTEWILIVRKKIERWATKPCKIPILPETRRILEKYRSKLPVLSRWTLNDNLKVIGAMIGYIGLSTKVGRSTAGTFLINHGVRLEVVAEVLGHANVRTTQRIYAPILVETVKSQTLHLMA
ncbi:site-specific integrase [Siphonobacter aquaeclarae]|uniref:site-specific integrase n=1 Tax=Siphonobacter aquaeclarae TaxID=563176 RepID=UPI00115FC9E9|nr:site-specific integrase [Siphonobacter aquaeclarae]